MIDSGTLHVRGVGRNRTTAIDNARDIAVQFYGDIPHEIVKVGEAIVDEVESVIDGARSTVRVHATFEVPVTFARAEGRPAGG